MEIERTALPRACVWIGIQTRNMFRYFVQPFHLIFSSCPYLSCGNLSLLLHCVVPSCSHWDPSSDMTKEVLHDCSYPRHDQVCPCGVNMMSGTHHSEAGPPCHTLTIPLKTFQRCGLSTFISENAESPGGASGTRNGYLSVNKKSKISVRSTASVLQHSRQQFSRGMPRSTSTPHAKR